MMKGPLAAMMQQAEKMKAELEAAKEKLAQLEVTGESGGGLVRVTMTGEHEARRVEINPTLFASDPEMAQDLIAAAINDAVNKIADASKDHMQGMASGLNIPGLKLPF